MYRCVGLVRGQYFPSSDVFTQGFVLTDDGCRFPAGLLGQVAKWLTVNPDQLNQSHVWLVWPRQRSGLPSLFFQLVRVYQSPDEKLYRSAASVNYFSIRGVVQSQEDGRLSIRIERNSLPPQGKEKAKRWQPFIMVVEGFLPESARGQFWQLDCYRDGERLVMEDGRPLQDAPKCKEKGKETLTAAQAFHAPKSSVIAPGAKATSSQPVQPKGDTMPTPGKMELTIKINQFPVDVKTVVNGWKQFEIDTGDRIVTITVKPKVFKKLEQAQADYPQWVAAIAGQMGDSTNRGFVLKEPNIQVFERLSRPQRPEGTEDKAFTL